MRIEPMAPGKMPGLLEIMDTPAPLLVVRSHPRQEFDSQRSQGDAGVNPGEAGFQLAMQLRELFWPLLQLRV
jgi:hypothetical protein